MKWLVALLAWPLLAQQQAAPAYANEKEQAMGSMLAAEVRRHSQSLDEPTVNAYVQRIGSSLAAGLPGSPTVYHFEVIVSDATEAVALPGGFILIPTSTLLAANNESQVAGMIAHAIGHIALRHGFTGADRPTSGPLIYFGAGSGLEQQSRSPGGRVPVGFQARQRQNEKEADRFATELISRTAALQADNTELHRVQAAMWAALPVLRRPAPTLVR